MKFLRFYIASIFVIATVISGSAEDFTTHFLDWVGSGKYWGQQHDGRHTGMGMKVNSKEVMMGDYYEGDLDGIGMKINNPDRFLFNNSSAVIYVGEWENGKMSGHGRLYNENGTLVYEGEFANGKPYGNMAMFTRDDARTFGWGTIYDNIKYLGELYYGQPDGYGCLMFEGDNRGYKIGQIESGGLIGISLWINGPTDKDWELANFFSTGPQGVYFATPKMYENVEGERILREEQAKQEFKQGMKEVGLGLMQTANNYLEMKASQTNGGTYTGSTVDYYSGSSSGGSSSSSSSSSSSKDNSPSKGGSWYQSKSRAYSSYEDQIVKMQTGSRDCSDRVSIQQKMRHIREEVTKAGYPMNQSPMETWHP